MTGIRSASLKMLALPAVLGALLLAAPAALAFPDGYSGPLHSASSSLCLNVYRANTKDGASVDQAYCNGRANQSWKVISDPFGAYDTVMLRNGGSGKCLDVYGGSTTNGAKVVQWDCHSLDGSEIWIVVTHIAHGRTVYGFANLQGGSACKCLEMLDVARSSAQPGAHVVQWQYNGGWNQVWYARVNSRLF
jgi:Ricin-type beta-trefoil lectin domain-like